MDYFSLWPTLCGVIYAFGVALHYLHVGAVFHLLDKYDQMDKRRQLFWSLLWPITVIQIGFSKDDT